MATHFIQKDKDLRLPKNLKVGEIVTHLCRPFAIHLLQCTFHLLTLDIFLAWLSNMDLSINPLELSSYLITISFETRPFFHFPMCIFKSSLNLSEVMSKNLQL